MNSWITVAYAIPAVLLHFRDQSSSHLRIQIAVLLDGIHFSAHSLRLLPQCAGGTSDECFRSCIRNVLTKQNAAWSFRHGLAGHVPYSSEPFPMPALTSQRLVVGRASPLA